jgi:hypothetical protein
MADNFPDLRDEVNPAMKEALANSQPILVANY